MTSNASHSARLSAAELLNLFEQKGALLKGHFKLTSGLHSDTYLQCALILQYPDLAQRIGLAIAKNFSDTAPDCVIGPATGGIVVAHEVARALGVRAMFSERESGLMTLRRGFTVSTNERVLVAEDIITTGGSVQEVIDTVLQAGATVVGVGVIIDRSGGTVGFDVPFRALAQMPVQTFNREECPLCRRNVPLSTPGSRKS